MDFAARRGELVERLAERVDDEDVLAAMRAVPRHEFVPEDRRGNAYADRPLPIGGGQTISAPHMVAMMAELLDLREGDAVLEVGTGCGYHAAVTAELVGDEGVYTVEYRESLAEDARERLADLGYEGISVRVGDGKEGWEAHAPYDRAYLTAAAPEFPGPVVEQVRPGGLLLAPIGTGRQRLVRARKRADGELDRDSHGAVRFVRLQ
ncbi:protein-L-isoaspartate(D-aspartate) O-methyltransferase [Halomicrobium urmianum]|uniref:protein-L-isoaspartate(D-aspartate) O-methyltransferase n=1 Tax=Halomicrobium urmianum TaxID=1586233 RepID=UPI001CD9AA55|nr:protein-L-isoaspartate(D-aspartate) O-methyltransferase [Halomicrobium urmianum]